MSSDPKTLEDFEHLLKIISDEVANLHAIFNVCRDVQPLADPLNREQSVASFAIGSMLLALEDDTILRIFRLCERPGKGKKGKATLTLESLIHSLPADRLHLADDLRNA